MNYNFSNLSTVAQCDEIIAKNTVTIDDRDFRKLSIERQLANASEDASDIQLDLQTAQTELQYLNETLPNVPEGEERNQMLDDINNLENEIILLNRRAQRDRVGASQFLQYSLAVNERIINSLTNFNAQVVARKGELPG